MVWARGPSQSFGTLGSLKVITELFSQPRQHRHVGLENSLLRGVVQGIAGGFEASLASAYQHPPAGTCPPTVTITDVSDIVKCLQGASVPLGKNHWHGHKHALTQAQRGPPLPSQTLRRRQLALSSSPLCQAHAQSRGQRRVR